MSPMAFGMVQQQVGVYRIDSVLGEGGNATVYRAIHEKLGSVHAVKVVAAPDDRMRARLMREGRAQGAVRHTNLVAVTEVVELEIVEPRAQSGWIADQCQGWIWTA